MDSTNTWISFVVLMYRNLERYAHLLRVCEIWLWTCGWISSLNFYYQVLEIKRDEKKIFVTQYVGTTVRPKVIERWENKHCSLRTKSLKPYISYEALLGFFRWDCISVALNHWMVHVCFGIWSTLSFTFVTNTYIDVISIDCSQM